MHVDTFISDVGCECMTYSALLSQLAVGYSQGCLIEQKDSDRVLSVRARPAMIILKFFISALQAEAVSVVLSVPSGRLLILHVLRSRSRTLGLLLPWLPAQCRLY